MLQLESFKQDERVGDLRQLLQYGLLSHHELLYPGGHRRLDYDALELDVEMMLSAVDY